MAFPWEELVNDRGKVEKSIRASGLAGHIYLIIGFVFAILGVISDAMNVSLGLEATSWFLLAITAILAGLFPWLTWVVSVYLNSLEDKSKREE
jgi:uncharacterized membrane protein